jgi:hypothetical protein
MSCPAQRTAEYIATLRAERDQQQQLLHLLLLLLLGSNICLLFLLEETQQHARVLLGFVYLR